MALRVPTLDETHAFLLALLKVLFPDADVSVESFLWRWTRVIAGAVTDNFALILSVLADLLPDTAEGEGLDRWGKIRRVPRKAATGARKAKALRVFGTPGSNGVYDEELTHVSGLRFLVTSAEAMGSDGYVDVDVEAIDTGRRTRLRAGERLAFRNALPGIEEQAELQLDLDEGGEDEEPDGEYRLRVLSRFATPALGGAQHDYVQWALERRAVSAAFAYPNRAGLGSVDVAALRSGTGAARVLSASELADVDAYVKSKRPAGAEVRLLAVVTQPVDIEVAVMPNGESQYQFDWLDTTPLVVSSWSPDTRTLTFTFARPDTVRPGHRLSLKPVGGGGTGEPLVIESLASTNAVVLERAPSPAPAAGDVVYAAGPLVAPVRAAIVRLVDGLGTANPDIKRYGDWEGALRLAALFRAVHLVPGVIDLTIIAPATNVNATDPEFPNDDQINLLVPGRVLVRRLWT